VKSTLVADFACFRRKYMTAESELPGPQKSSDLLVPIETAPPQPAAPALPEPTETRFLKWLLFGRLGVRVGWSVTLFLLLAFLFTAILAVSATLLQPRLLDAKSTELSPATAIVQESLQFLGLFAAGLICSLIERRRILDYNLTGSHRLRHFLIGLVAGFLALSALAGALYAGGWLHIGPASLSGVTILEYGGFWGFAFLLTGLSEEGMVRCYMLFTLTRGINYWWALGSVASFSLFAFLNSHGSGAGGVYLMALLGVAPCLLLHLRKSPSSGFWQAAWLTSAFFGYIHTFNQGETWIGIFSAAAIGFVFCASVWLTGSAWWAIGFHASWDWAQTFFYGTPDSGFLPRGHYLTTSPAGAALWSGGSAGPEGSLLILPTVLVVLVALVVFYRRPKPLSNSDPVQQQLAV
jgi:uncharacterized protein